MPASVSLGVTADRELCLLYGVGAGLRVNHSDVDGGRLCVGATVGQDFGCGTPKNVTRTESGDQLGIVGCL